jgi:hypothetical protein
MPMARKRWKSLDRGSIASRTYGREHVMSPHWDTKHIQPIYTKTPSQTVQNSPISIILINETYVSFSTVLSIRAVLLKTLAQFLAASRMSTTRSPPRPLSCVLCNHLLYLDDQLPILGKPILPRGEMVKQRLCVIVGVPNTGIIAV